MRSFSLLLAFLSLHSSYAFDRSTPYESEPSRGGEETQLNGLRRPFSPLLGASLAHEKRPIGLADDFNDLLDVFPGLDTRLSNAIEIDARGLSTATLSDRGWSYHSFPTYRGGLANRFNSSAFNRRMSWRSRYEYYRDNPPTKLIANGDLKELSPIEKYEYFVGSTDFALTEYQWREGQDAMTRYGEVPTWFGSCHGTAPAAVKHTRPAKAVQVPSYDGRHKITFYPSDLKALLSYAWARNAGPSAMIGTRCERYGAEVPRSCYDTNPGAFHMALTNLIGLHDKPLIVDTSSDAQVWNRPIVSYELKYFNPLSRNYTRKIEHSIITRDQFTNDRYAHLRDPKYKKVVGVWAKVTFINDTSASSSTTDSPRSDRYENVKFTYDLELDDAGNILGGMWYEEQFPDFAWVVSSNSLPLTIEDRSIISNIIIYDGNQPIPAYLQQLAQMASKRGQVSFKVIDMLLNLAKNYSPDVEDEQYE